jgi:hypothetical protein
MPKQLYVPPTAGHLKEDTYCALHHPHVEKYDVQPLIKQKMRNKCGNAYHRIASRRDRVTRCGCVYRLG